MSGVDLAFERRLLDGLGRLLLTENDRRHASAVLLDVRARLDQVPAVAFKHKVTPIMARNARDLAGSPDRAVASAAERLTRELAEEDAKAMAHRALLAAEIVRLAPALHEHGCLIKGFCNGRFYPMGYHRWMRDIDVYCRTWADALRLVHLLSADGYTADFDECGWIKADPAHGCPEYGQIFLIRAGASGVCRIDVHFGTYSVGYAGYLDPKSIDHADELDVDDGTVRVLSAQAIPLIAAAHALSDGYVAVKDVNDFVALAVTESVDWSAVGRELARYALQPQASLLARHVLRLYDHPLVTSAARILLAATGTPRASLWQTHNRSWTLRAAVNASFAARWRHANGHSAASALVDAGRCYLFYVRRLRLEVRPRSRPERLLRALMARPDLREWRLRPDACLLLVDSDVLADLTDAQPAGSRRPWRHVAAPLDEVVILESGKICLLDVAGRTFVPTLDLIVDPDEAHAAQAAAVAPWRA